MYVHVVTCSPVRSSLNPEKVNIVIVFLVCYKV